MLHAAAGVEDEASHLLTAAQVQRMGHCLLGALLQLQHYGAIDKTAEGFQMVIKRYSLYSRACSKQVLTPSPGAEPCAFHMDLSIANATCDAACRAGGPCPLQVLACRQQ